MASPYSQLLGNVMGRMQESAQAAVPVTPANGNPNGAYNMPQGGQPAMAAPSVIQYSTSSPSPFMQNIQGLLAQRQQALTQGTMQPAMQAPAMPNTQAPVLPTANNPVLPSPQVQAQAGPGAKFNVTLPMRR